MLWTTHKSKNQVRHSKILGAKKIGLENWFAICIIDE